MLKQIPIFTFCIYSLLGCGSDKAEVKVTQNITEVPELNTMSVALTPLKASTTHAFELHLKNGVYLRSVSFGKQLPEAVTFDASSQSVGSTNYSSTVLQEDGVDESDRIKYNGDYIYIANNPSYSDQVNILPSTTIDILQRNSQGDVTKTAEISLNTENPTTSDIYIHEDSLVAMSNNAGYGIFETNTISTSEMFFPIEQSFNLSFVDISSPSSPALTTSYKIDGHIIDSRRIGNKLYVASSYAPYISGLPFSKDKQQQLSNYKKVFEVNVNELLPKVTNEQGIRSNLVNADQCYTPEGATDKDGFDGLVTLTTFDLEQPDIIESICMNSDVSGIYATTNSIYLYGTHYGYDIESQKSNQTSVIHKFSLSSDALTYQASGTLDGRFNWGMSNLRFDEYQNTLRAVTTTGDRNEGFQHKLNILKYSPDSNNNNRLSLVAQLPNDAQPEKIGKVTDSGIVQEDIKAVRFTDNRAYIVTFLTTDPLYVIDLESPEQPVIAGALEIPGYSSYLHPISNELLLGVGQNIDPNLFSIDEDNDTDNSPIIEGAKVSLFDVSNITAPSEITSIVYENGYTPVEFNYHALTYLKTTDNKLRFGLPIERWHSTTVTDAETNVKTDIWMPENFLALIEVSSQTSNALLQDVGSIKPILDDTTHNRIAGWDSRAIFHSNDIYYLHGNDIWRAFWDNPENTTGPF